MKKEKLATAIIVFAVSIALIWGVLCDWSESPKTTGAQALVALIGLCGAAMSGAPLIDELNKHK